MIKRAPLLALLLVCLAAAPAFAANIYTQLIGPTDVESGGVSAASGSLPGSPGGGGAQHWSHSFTVSDPNIEILSAAIGVYVADDSGCFGLSGVGLLGCDWVDHFYEDEAVEIDVAGEYFASGGPGGYFSFIDPALLSSAVELSAWSLFGDASIYSVLRVEYTTNGTGGSAVPEPHSVALFGIGALLVSAATRRRRA